VQRKHAVHNKTSRTYLYQQVPAGKFHLEEQNWYVLENILIAYIKHGDISLPDALDLIGCFYSYG
jgi:hypothetical protein